MLRPVSLPPALAAATLSLVLLVVVPWLPLVPLTPGAAAAPRQESETPLTVTIDRLSRSTIPRKGPIKVSGSVTNEDTEAWIDVSLYAFLGETPITTSAGLAEAAETPEDADVGSRILTPGTYDVVDRIEPGASARFSFTVPHDEITVTEPGVYWFGVHALGTGPEGRIDGADGRARTFLPLVPPTNATVDTALVVPVRHRIRYAADGSLTQVRSWARALGARGSLHSIVDFGSGAGPRTLNWLVDPAVPDAVRALVAGNPPRSTGDTVTEPSEGGGSPGPSASDEPTDGATDDGGDGDGDGDQPPRESPALTAAGDAGAAWLELLHENLQDSGQVLTLPYGDVDVAAAADHDPSFYERARTRSGDELQPWGLPTSPAVAPPGGYLDAAGIRETAPGTTLLVSDQMFGGTPPSVARTEGRTLVVTSSDAASGGPGPGNPLAPLAVRQRIVSEAALHLMAPGRPPLVVTFPTGWAPPSSPGFFPGLDLDWLHLASLDEVERRPGTDVPVDQLDYPESQEELELGPGAFAAAGDLVDAGETLQNVLTRNDRVAGEVSDEAFSGTSYSSRLHRRRAIASAERSRRWIESRLDEVRIDAPSAVILSSGSGRFAATITNGLDQPVTVKIGAVADRPLRVEVPTDSVDIGPESRTTVLLNATSSAIGVRNVTLLLTDTGDVPIGSSEAVQIRSNRVSNVIWVILGTGVALLFGAIVVRLFRRVRAARS